MANDYKATLKKKKAEADKLMTKKQFTECNVAIHTASVAAAAGGGIPIPVMDAIPITTAQISMVLALGKIFEQKVSEASAKGIVAAAASTFVGRNLVKLIPIVGWGVSAAVAAGVTEAIGWTVAVDFANSYKKDVDLQLERKQREDEARREEELRQAREVYRRAFESETDSAHGDASEEAQERTQSDVENETDECQFGEKNSSADKSKETTTEDSDDESMGKDFSESLGEDE